MRGIIILIIAVFSIPAAFADIIYDEQTYNSEETWNFYSIYGGYLYETADDFETTDDWTLNLVRFWILTGIYNFGNTPNLDIRVDVFEDASGYPGGIVFQEVVPSENITWTEVGSIFYDIYQADIPVIGFDIKAGKRY
jgi:hypothetical protein